jgi:hypothetical protein
VERVGNFFQLEVNERRVYVATSVMCDEECAGFVDAVFSCEPAGGFRS